MAGNSARTRGSKPGSVSMSTRRAAGDDRLDGRVPAPEVGAAQRADAGNFHQSCFRSAGSVFCRYRVEGLPRLHAGADQVELRYPAPRRRHGGQQRGLERPLRACRLHQAVSFPRPGRTVSLLPVASTTWSWRTNTARPPLRCAAMAGASRVGAVEDHFAVAQAPPSRRRARRRH